MYYTCRWCGGSGCLACPPKKKQIEPQPMFVANLNDKDDVQALKRAFGRDAIEKAFSPNGRGMQEIRENAALESLKQTLRKLDNPTGE